MFVNLNVRSHYSLLLSTLSLQDIVDYALAQKQKYVVLTDINVLYGAVEFFDLATKHGLIPIIGLEIFDHRSNSNLVLIAKNNEGYVNLLKISSAIETKQDFDINQYLDHVAVILKEGDFKPQKNVEFYVCNNPKAKNAIALNEVNCKNEADAYLINVMQAIKKEQVFEDEAQMRMLANKTWFIDEAEAQKRFSDTQLKNLKKLLADITWDINAFHTELLKYPAPKKIASSLFLQSLCKEGLKKRFCNTTIPKVYVDRLKHELDVIDEMGFNDYFLIVYDFINFARTENIVVGPGRGSAVGSLVAYALHITDVDPIKFNLIFERFLNSERKSMPDIDVDIMDTRRDEIIDYLFGKYGKDHVAHIITFQRIKAKMALRDVGRVLKIDLKEIDLITKLIDSKHDEDIEAAIKHSSKLAKKADEYPLLFTIASKLINVPRQVGTHAAGVVLSNEILTNIIPVQTGINNRLMSQFSMEYLERFGLLKMDLLGLRNLTILDNIIKLINKKTKTNFNLYNIPIHDKRTYELFASGNTNGIFQFESPGMKSTLKRMVPKNLEDLSLVSSLYRPGPQENIPLFIKLRNKEAPVEYISDSLKPILADTNGIIVYQEQVIQIVQAVANFSPAQADIFRRAISKKDESKMQELKQEFIQKAIANNYSEENAQKIYDYIYQFANYGFNHSHAIAYSLIGYWLGYFKVNYPLEFYVTLLHANSGSTDKINTYVTEAMSKSIDVHLPDINISGETFRTINKTIYFGFNCIKGIGNESIKKILEARNSVEDKSFKSFPHAIALLSQHKVTAKMIESLIYAGAFDCFGLNRKTMISNLEDVLSIATFDPQASQKYKLEDEAMSESDKQEYEKLQQNAIGIVLPQELSVLKGVRKNVPALLQLKTLDYILDQDNVFANVVVLVNKVKITKTKNGKFMAFLSLQDDSASYDKVIVWPAQYEKYKDIIKPNLVCILSVKNDGEKLVVFKVLHYYDDKQKYLTELK